ncbi:uridine phosphorylase [Balneicella halophila]|uniref:Uridine phosphorylase n=1 Tax=Balneicella halophila TaxID=1537566 RepID=A0A7L4URQ4_BALHA|nr:nucleoside phosphorylase [Balneicella halophila]PVX52182.1 uridine phosphorylase [Balneicella halophila]
METNSELIINKDGSIFHLHLRPEQLAETVILVGDPGRVDLVASFFESVEHHVSSREFVTKTGYYNGKRLSVVSTGIGTDNIDIVITELDALVNMDFETLKPKEQHTELNIVRVGTSGGLRADIPVNSFLLSEKSIGFDGMLNFYADRDKVADLEFEKAFKKHMDWMPNLASPYIVDASTKLLDKLMDESMMKGVTVSANGFYGPQGRVVRLKTADPELNDKLASFEYKNFHITNYEMESSAIFGLSKLLGHQAACCCLIIANRVLKEANSDYHPKVQELIELVLNKLTSDE